ncbi:MAG: HAMP domain-containing protein [Pseudomonadales bacterium]|nr:HAMP domain-containing protein [Pseudomonadales bacterium]
MVRALASSWFRVGVWTVLLGLFLMTAMIGVYRGISQHDEVMFYSTLPVDVRMEYQHLQEEGKLGSDRAILIRAHYDSAHGPRSIYFWIGCLLVLTMSLGGGAAWYVRRLWGRPLQSLSEAATRIAQGDYSVRAQSAIQGELAHLATNFNVMAAHLERLEVERKDTIAGISHELRTPLTILRGRLHALCDGVIPSSLAELHKLLEHTEHLVRLVEDINTVTLGEGNRLSLHRSEVDLQEFLLSWMPVYSSRLDEEGVHLVLDLQPIKLMIDTDRLRQVMTNLVENVLRYAATGGVLEVGIHREADMAVLQVADRGPGFPEVALGRIFDAFYRVDHSRSRALGGTGLGLAVVQTLVHQHGGHIQVHNREGGGAEFLIYLPLV